MPTIPSGALLAACWTGAGLEQPVQKASKTRGKKQILQSGHGLFSFECKVGLDLAGWGHGDLLFLRPQRFVPGFYHVIARRHIVNLESPIRPGDGEIGMVHDADVGVHPAMDVAFHPNHHFGLDELARQRSVSLAPGYGSIRD